MLVYVLNKNKQPLMPTTPKKARLLLKEGKAKVLTVKPFTIQLLFGSSGYKQEITLGVDSGYKNIGFSAVTEQKEIISGECKLLDGMSERIRDRANYRRQRRAKLRYRAKRFNNRTRTKGWLAPSIQHKFDSHIRLIDKLKSILPITKVIIEVANFDIQAIKNPEIKGYLYQLGEQMGFWNLREYVLHRDNHQCQNPNCKNKEKNPILKVHHIGFWKQDRTNRPANLLTLCDKCHTPKNHKESGFLFGWKPKLKSFRPETFMSIIRWKLVNLLKVEHTYGFFTKSKRIANNIEKSHANDAFVIANGEKQGRIPPIFIEQIRRNNRSLQKFYDAKFIDTRTGEKVSASELFSGRTTRNKNLNSENLRLYRGEKLSKGRITIRRKRSLVQSRDIILFEGKKYQVQGAITNGKYVKLVDMKKTPRTEDIKIYKYGKGFRVA